MHWNTIVLVTRPGWVPALGLNEIDFAQLYKQHYYAPDLKLLGILVGGRKIFGPE